MKGPEKPVGKESLAAVVEQEVKGEKYTGGVSTDQQERYGFTRLETDEEKEAGISGKKEEIQANFPPEEAAEVKKPLDISFLKNRISEMEASAKKQGWIKRNFGSSGETIKRLKAGLYKIEDPRFKGSFAKAFQAAYEQGGEKLAFEYAEAIGNGELVRPEGGVLMMSDQRSQDNFFNNN